MAEQHVKLLQGLGVSQEAIDAVEKLTPEEAKGWSADETTKLVKSALKPSFETEFLNDQEFLNKIPEEKIPKELLKKVENGQMTRFQTEMMEVAKKELGLDDKDFEDMNKKEKDSIIKTMTKHIATKHLSKKGNVEGLQQMQKDLGDMTAKLEKKDEEWQEKLTKDLNEVNGKASARVIKALTSVRLAGLDVDLGVAPGFITDPLLAQMNNKYTVVLGDNDELDIKQKANPALDVLDGSNKKVTFDAALKNLVIENKLGKERVADDGKGKGNERKRVTVNDDDDKGGSGEYQMPDYIAKKAKQTEDAEAKFK